MGVQKGHLPRKKPKWPKVARLGTVSTEVFDGLKFPGFGGLEGLKVFTILSAVIVVVVRR